MATNQSLLADHARALAYARNGGRRPARFERQENIRTSVLFSATMPLDVEAHWTWRNPLNVIPAFMLLVLLIGIIGTIVSLI